MNTWLIIGLIVILIVFFAFRKLSASSKAINDYFCDAALVFGFTGEESAKLAALAAAKTAAGAQRASMIDYLVGISTDSKGIDPDGSTEFRERLNDLKSEIVSKDWTVKDSADAKTLLNELDPAAMQALNKSDKHYFRNKFPKVFED